MFKRFFWVAMLALVAAANSGCCGCARDRLCGSYWNRHFGCPQCGEVYWSEWFNDPPNCCDPCDRCGNFVGGHHGNPHQMAMGPGGSMHGDEEVFADE